MTNKIDKIHSLIKAGTNEYSEQISYAYLLALKLYTTTGKKVVRFGDWVIFVNATEYPNGCKPDGCDSAVCQSLNVCLWYKGTWVGVLSEDGGKKEMSIGIHSNQSGLPVEDDLIKDAEKELLNIKKQLKNTKYLTE